MLHYSVDIKSTAMDLQLRNISCNYTRQTDTRKFAVGSYSL